MRSLLGRFHRPMSRGLVNNMLTMNNLGDGSTLSLDFTTMGGVLDPRLTFSRASTATFVNSSGYVEYAGANMIFGSQSFATSGMSINWTEQDIFSRTSGQPDPMGGSTATAFQESRADGYHRISFYVLHTTTPVVATVSIFVKKINANRRVAINANGALDVSAIFDLITGTQVAISGTAPNKASSITSFGNDWWRISVTGTNTGASSATYFAICAANSTDPTGANFVGTTDGGVCFWGAQLNPGSTAQTYYPTTTAAYHAPRFDYSPTNIGEPRGLLVEGQTSNIIRHSSAPQSWVAAVSGTTITDGSGFAPDNSSTPKQLAMTSGGYCYQVTQANQVAGTYTYSVWLKASSNQSVGIRVSRTGDGAVKGMITAAVTTTWTRFEVPITSNATDTLDCGFDQRSLPPSVPGPAVAATFLMWGAQLEAGSGASSYIPTGASQVTRNADSCLMSGKNFSDWFTTAGTFLIEHQLTNAFGSTDRAQVGLGQYSPGTSAFALFRTNATTAGAAVWGSGGTGYQEGTSVVSARTPIRSGMTLDFTGATRSLRAFANGTTGASLISTTGTISVDRMFIGSNGSGTSSTRDYQNGHIRSLKFWPSVLSNNELQALTTP